MIETKGSMMTILFEKFTFKWPKEPNPLLTIPLWKLASGSHVLIWGESGMGKTTLLHCMGGLLDATEGDVVVDGLAYRKMHERDRLRLRRDSITMVFQRLNLLKHLTAIENVMLGIHGKPSTGKNVALHALERVGMASMAHRFAWNLSAGEQQRVALARALVRQSNLTLADEPTANMDRANALRAMEELRSDIQRRNHTLVIVSHDERIRSMFDLSYHIEELATLCPASH